MYTDNPYFIVYSIAVIYFFIYTIPRVVRSKWWQKYIVTDFPEVHPPYCADCHEQSCKGCPFDK